MKHFNGKYQGGSTTSGAGYLDTVKAAAKLQPRCYESHPALPIGEYEIYGGSCSHPIVEDADIYIGFDGGMHFTAGAQPWHAKVQEVYFPIRDMDAPSNAKEFKHMVVWVAEQLKAGKKIHAGCIGGHGRTGTFFAALYAYMTGEPDAITYVRKHYCDKAVESKDQIDFLNKHYGITKVKAGKHFSFLPGESYGGKGSGKAQADLYKGLEAASETLYPVESAKSLWGKQ